MKKIFTLCFALVMCAAMVSLPAATQTTKGGGWNGGTVTKSTTFTSSVLFNGSVSGLQAGSIPSLDASKITTGTFGAAQIPSLDASKITTGTFGAARLGSGTPTPSNFLRGDGTWAAPTVSSYGLSYSMRFGTTQDVINSTTLVNDDTVSVSLAAGAVYEINAILMGNSAGTGNGGLKARLNFATAGFSWSGFAGLEVRLMQNATCLYNSYINSATLTTTATNFNGDFVYTARGLIQINSADTLRFQFAQNTATANGLTIYPGSFISIRKI